MSKNLLARIAVAAVAIPTILIICYLGGLWLFGMVSLFALVAAGEFLLNEKCGPGRLHFWLVLAAIGGCLAMTLRTIPSQPDPVSAQDIPMFYLFMVEVIIGYFLVSSMIFAMGKKTPGQLFAEHSRLFWGTCYLGLCYPFVYALGNDHSLDQVIHPASRGDLLLFLFGLLWIGDTCAMGFGKWLGKHKLAPAVSPNKTVEGFIGGIAGAVAVGVLMHFWKFPQFPFLHLMLITIGCSVFGQLGDLVESLWKRSLGIKDSSAIIPGHGGVLDRFDSLLFAAPFMYAYLTFMIYLLYLPSNT